MSDVIASAASRNAISSPRTVASGTPACNRASRRSLRFAPERRRCSTSRAIVSSTRASARGLRARQRGQKPREGGHDRLQVPRERAGALGEVGGEKNVTRHGHRQRVDHVARSHPLAGRPSFRRLVRPPRQGLATRPHPSPGQGGLERAAAAAVLLTVQRVERRPHEAARALLSLAGRKRGAVRYENAPDLLGVTHHHEPLRAGPQAKDRLPCAPPLHVGPSARKNARALTGPLNVHPPGGVWRPGSSPQ